MVERKGGESEPAWGSIEAQRLPKRVVIQFICTLLFLVCSNATDRIHSGPRVPPHSLHHHVCVPRLDLINYIYPRVSSYLYRYMI